MTNEDYSGHTSPFESEVPTSGSAQPNSNPSAGAQLKHLKDLKPAPYNPRRISAPAQDGLQESLHQFGDISGIVFNTRTGHLVAGHQRLAALKQRFGALLTLEHDAHGNPLLAVEGTDHRFPIRVVDWDESKEKLANLSANNPHIAGEFTDSVVGIIEELGHCDLSSLITPLRIEDIISPDATSPGNKLPEPGDAEKTRLDFGWGVIVNCESEQEQVELLERFAEEGLECRPLIS